MRYQISCNNLDQDEQLNEEAMFAIYEKKGGQLALFEDAEPMISTSVRLKS